MHRGLGGFLLVMAIGLMAGNAGAAQTASTKYTYYPINGSSARELDNAMYRQGPRVAGQHAYASTRFQFGWEALMRQGKTCRPEKFTLKTNFIIRLPKLASKAGLSQGVASRFASFASFARRHEETHRTIWQECGRRAERAVQGLSVKSCAALSAAITSTLKRTLGSCEARHAAFDAAEQKRLARHPFIVSALARPAKKRRK